MLSHLKEKLGENLKEKVILANYTTFRIGGAARYFYIAKTKEEIIKAVAVAEKNQIEYFILGGGSNVLVSDSGFEGLVIKIANSQVKISKDTVHAEAGTNIGFLVNQTVIAGLTGLEFMAGIPGTVGGAAFGNAGALGKGFGNKVVEVEVFENGEIKRLTQEQMGYSYRHSVLKESSAIILSVKIKLEKDKPENCQRRMLEVIKDRKSRIPPLPSAGCVFKNVNLKEIKVDRERIIKELDVSKEEYNKATKYQKLPVGFILDKLDLKGKTIGGAQISGLHGGFIVNIGDAKAEHVMMLISDIKMRVRNQLGIQLQEEIRYLGF